MKTILRSVAAECVGHSVVDLVYRARWTTGSNLSLTSTQAYACRCTAARSNIAVATHKIEVAFYITSQEGDEMRRTLNL